MRDMALLVVDVQEALIAYHPYQEEKLLANIKELLIAARENNIEVIYVRHNDKAGGELEPDSKGWQIHNLILPKADEKIFDKRYNSAFKDTGLKEYLYGKSINKLIITGMQTEYCIDTTVKAAFEYGFTMIIPAGTTSTYGNSYLSGEQMVKFYEQKIWGKRFADILPMNEVILQIKFGQK